MPIVAMILFAFLVSMMINSFWLKQIKDKQLGQTIREDGPRHHHLKAGTPTMGGVAIFSALLLLTLLFIEDLNRVLLGLLVLTMSMMLLGFIDDLLKIKRGKNKGVKGIEKFSIQVFLSALFACLLTSNGYDISHIVNLPDWSYYFWVIFIISGSSNAVNLTDGLDGLAAGLAVITFSGLSYLAIHINEQYYLFGVLIIFVLIAFLFYNQHPAKMFMGDAGSLPLGALMAGFALIMKVELFLIPFALVFILEVLSVIFQVAYFKTTGGKRLFKMSPFHHHLELSGWSEKKVVLFFYLTQLIAVLMGVVCYHVC